MPIWRSLSNDALSAGIQTMGKRISPASGDTMTLAGNDKEDVMLAKLIPGLLKFQTLYQSLTYQAIKLMSIV